MLSPYNFCLAVLLQLAVQDGVAPITTAELVMLVTTELDTHTTHIEKSLADLCRQLDTALGSNTSGAYTQQLLDKLGTIETPDHVADIIDEFSQLLETSTTRQNNKTSHIHRDSVAGMFLRRLVLSFHELLFDGLNRLFLQLQSYVAEYTRKMDMSNTSTATAAFPIADVPSSPLPHYEQGGDVDDSGDGGGLEHLSRLVNLEQQTAALASAPQLERFVYDVTRLIEHGYYVVPVQHAADDDPISASEALADTGNDSSLLDMDMSDASITFTNQQQQQQQQQRRTLTKIQHLGDVEEMIDELEAAFPYSLPKVHYLRYVYSLQSREWEAAVDGLHRYFDYVCYHALSLTGNRSARPAATVEDIKQQTSMMTSFAVLNLAVLHYRFGHYDAAFHALQEAVKISHQRSDHSSLAVALSWIVRLALASDRLRVRAQKLLANSIARARQLSMHELLSQLQLTAARIKALRFGSRALPSEDISGAGVGVGSIGSSTGGVAPIAAESAVPVSTLVSAIKTAAYTEAIRNMIPYPVLSSSASLTVSGDRSSGPESSLSSLSSSTAAAVFRELRDSELLNAQQSLPGYLHDAAALTRAAAWQRFGNSALMLTSAESVSSRSLTSSPPINSGDGSGDCEREAFDTADEVRQSDVIAAKCEIAFTYAQSGDYVSAFDELLSVHSKSLAVDRSAASNHNRRPQQQQQQSAALFTFGGSDDDDSGFVRIPTLGADDEHHWLWSTARLLFDYFLVREELFRADCVLEKLRALASLPNQIDDATVRAPPMTDSVGFGDVLEATAARAEVLIRQALLLEKYGRLQQACATANAAVDICLRYGLHCDALRHTLALARIHMRAGDSVAAFRLLSQCEAEAQRQPTLQALGAETTLALAELTLLSLPTSSSPEAVIGSAAQLLKRCFPWLLQNGSALQIGTLFLLDASVRFAALLLSDEGASRPSGDDRRLARVYTSLTKAENHFTRIGALAELAHVIELKLQIADFQSAAAADSLREQRKRLQSTRERAKLKSSFVLSSLSDWLLEERHRLSHSSDSPETLRRPSGGNRLDASNELVDMDMDLEDSD